MAPEIGRTAPGFTLPDAQRQPVSLDSVLDSGRSALIVFYPFAFSGICGGELEAVQDSLDTFQNDRVQILAVSCDPTFALAAWAGSAGFSFPLLSDFWPHGAVASQYGVFNADKGMALRGTFLVLPDGRVSFAEVNQPGEPRDPDGWRRVLGAM
ncbi:MULTISPECIES: peroxiredoxin [Pseudonocardia]|uniref:Peroxiredoxin n=2 Tax=Pseudonocardia TaxID=1847 RepID=A0ABQ0S7H9_9PSEU|nr:MULTISPECIES: peroxiredoxin [Pseudonocardia]OSY36867.1 putative peroxiredoxin [Pseudonocardia autotrophica]TDN76858.1 peroxiredoxin [Pseudonocardia autotrophica]BBG00859.1 peroxiredoxin [Pseudonocardia autotrophica]GEC28874.1 peroxiredoxin [Pseudonocardia saturnea]